MSTNKTEFERLNEGKSASLFAEFWQFVRENRKWWLLPILLALLLVSLLILSAGSGAAPFIYTLF